MVRLHGPWDYKNQLGHQYDDFGNFNYGAVGTAAGFPEQVLLRGAGWAQGHSGNGNPAKFGVWYGAAPYGDDPADQVWIRAGIDYAKRTGF
ncbi:polymorphic toxin type 44 domain-containing protein [Pseudescherichia vulneris]|uniref:polymorphic toxin type 44 domain-containing protein n=1 Tax=Pseudescherichia vulneris TaxID=566 RepID=UPI00227B5692|nr:polymorphic toxin type 44 domain-containing protein [Pseudescherichia vulneris]WAH54532.1 polymorphic toxin type 44 domain-containing protein [Pseudescherichia vulneris]